MSHELVGLSEEELDQNYYKQDPELKSVLGLYLGKQAADE